MLRLLRPSKRWQGPSGNARSIQQAATAGRAPKLAKTQMRRTLGIHYERVTEGDRRGRDAEEYN